MSLWRQLTRGVRVLVHRSASDRDVDDEVQHFLDETTAALVARGLSPDEARRAARLELGSAAAVRDEVRATGWEHLVGTVAADVRYGARRLRHAPGFALVSALTLALGIGASTAIFSAVNPILFAAAALSAARTADDDLVRGPGWRARAPGVRHLSRAHRAQPRVQRDRRDEALAADASPGRAEPERVDGQRVSADYFRVFGVPPAIGQSFDAADDRPGGPHVVVLSDALWRRRFQSDATIVGRQIMLDDAPYTVVGVMPRGFENVLAPTAEIWSSLQYDPALPPESREWGHHLRMVGRARIRRDAGTRAPRVRGDRAPAAARAAPPVLRLNATWFDRECPAGRCVARRQAGAPGRRRRGGAPARDRLRKRHEPAARARRRNDAREFALRAALGAGRGAPRSSGHHREPARSPRSAARWAWRSPSLASAPWSP